MSCPTGSVMVPSITRCATIACLAAKQQLASPQSDSICAEIESLDISSYLLLVCNFWYEFSLNAGTDRYGFDFKKRSFVLFDDCNVAINTITWPQCGRAIVNLLSLKELQNDETDRSLTLSQFRNSFIYISSFRLTQRDMFESVKRITGTIDAYWTITYESAEQRWKDGQAALQQGNMKAFTEMLYSRMFCPNGEGDYQSSWGLHNNLLGLTVEDLDEFTAIGVRMGENGEVSQSHSGRSGAACDIAIRTGQVLGRDIALMRSPAVRLSAISSGAYVAREVAVFRLVVILKKVASVENFVELRFVPPVYGYGKLEIVPDECAPQLIALGYKAPRTDLRPRRNIVSAPSLPGLSLSWLDPPGH